MSDPKRITVLAESFSAAALEYHRKRMQQKGYRVDSRIDEAVFERVTPEGAYEPVLDGKPMYAITFVRIDVQDEAAA